MTLLTSSIVKTLVEFNSTVIIINKKCKVSHEGLCFNYRKEQKCCIIQKIFAISSLAGSQIESHGPIVQNDSVTVDAIIQIKTINY